MDLSFDWAFLLEFLYQMEKVDVSNLRARNAEVVGTDAEMDKVKHSVDKLSMEVDNVSLLL